MIHNGMRACNDPFCGCKGVLEDFEACKNLAKKIRCQIYQSLNDCEIACNYAFGIKENEIGDYIKQTATIAELALYEIEAALNALSKIENPDPNYHPYDDPSYWLMDFEKKNV